MSLPKMSESAKWRCQNYARLLLLGQTREQTNKTLSEIERIQGKDSADEVRAFLNHEKQAMKDGIELVKPQSVIDEEMRFDQSQQARDDRYEQSKHDFAESMGFVEKLAS